jgi:hypothetical protein
LDPSGILTILGLVVAVIAVIPRERRLDLSIRISRLDYLIIAAALILVHYIIYFPVLRKLGAGLDLGDWRYGFNEANTTYLIFLSLGIFLILRAKISKVTRSNINSANDLFEQLLLEKKYGELAILADKHIADISAISKSENVSNIIAKKIRPAQDFEIHLGIKKPSYFDKYLARQRVWISNLIEHNDDEKEIADNILRRVANNVEFVRHISISRPYLGIKIIETDTYFTTNFVDNFFASLIENETSVYFYELENTHNLISEGRYYLSKNNKLLYFLFNDIRVSKKLGIYKPVGDKVCNLLEYDKQLIAKYNEPLGDYYQSGLSKCPIDSSIHFFDVMLSESMHQGIEWHMWLFYFPSFVTEILNKLNPSSEVDFDKEWPTPFHYILYHIVSVMLDWLREYSNVENKNPLKMDNEQLHHDNSSIPKSTILALGNIIFSIISSPTVNREFKQYILEVVFGHIENNLHDQNQSQINRVLMKSILHNGYHNELKHDYIIEFTEIYQNIDHFLQSELIEFNTLLNSVRLECELKK